MDATSTPHTALRSLLVALLCGALLCGCTSPLLDEAQPSSSFPIPSKPPQAPLSVTLRPHQAVYAVGEPILVEWTIYNNNPDFVSFCTLNTPLHKSALTNCFVIVNEQNQPIPYIGDQPLRRGAAGPNDRDELPPKSQRSEDLNLRALYQLNLAGTYRVRFVGGPLNELEASRVVSFRLE